MLGAKCAAWNYKGKQAWHRCQTHVTKGAPIVAVTNEKLLTIIKSLCSTSSLIREKTPSVLRASVRNVCQLHFVMHPFPL